MNVFYPIGALYPSQLGGPNNTIYWMAKALVKVGVGVTIVTTHRGIKSDAGITFNKWIDLGYGRIKYLRVIHRLIPLRIYINSLNPLRKTDVVHLTSLFYSGSLILALTALMFRKRVIWSVRGELTSSALKYNTVFKRLILAVIGRIKSFIIFHGTSEDEIELIKIRFGPNTRTVHVPNYMELPDLRARSKSGKYLLFLGRIHEIKAIDHLIKALYLSKRFRVSSYKLMIIGDDDNVHARKLKKLVKGLDLNTKVKFIGYIDDELEKQKFLSRAHFLVLPSHSENFGNVIIESLAQGTPVIASMGTPWKSLQIERAGFWVDNSPESLAKAIDASIEMNEECYQGYRKKALEIVKRDYCIDRNVFRWKEIYENA